MKGYTYAHVLKEKGFEEVPKDYFISRYEEKRAYVETYLEPAIVNSNTGWTSVKYVVMKHPEIGYEEYVVISANKKNPLDGRYVEVTASSVGAILSSATENIW